MSSELESDIVSASERLNFEYHGKGRALRRVLESPHPSEAQRTSNFDSFILLSKWGWKDTTALELKQTDCSDIDGIADIVKTRPGIRFQWKHSREYRAEDVPKGITYRITHGSYYFRLWPTLGVIVVYASFSPTYMMEQQLFAPRQLDGEKRWREGKDRLPDLHRWSDIVYLTWKNQLSKTNEDVSNLRFVFQRYIENEETLKILAYVLRQQHPNSALPGRVPLWPDKRTVRRHEPGFDALLYTPNVRGVVWLLAQHRGCFGNKRIRSITAYVERTAVSYKPSLRIDIENAG